MLLALFFQQLESFLHSAYRVAVVVMIVRKQQISLGRQSNHLGGGGTRVNAYKSFLIPFTGSHTPQSVSPKIFAPMLIVILTFEYRRKTKV